MAVRVGKIDIDGGRGSVPLGAIIAIASNLSGAHTIPATGVMDSDGYQYCDGAAISGSAVMSGTIPNLTDSRFLMGASSAGSVGGQTNVTLAEANLPSHTHGMQNHTHGGTTGNISADHTHTMATRPTFEAPSSPNTFQAINHSAGNTTAIASSGVSSNHTHSFTTGGPSNNTTTSTGSGTAYDNRPLYLATQYLMRVK